MLADAADAPRPRPRKRKPSTAWADRAVAAVGSGWKDGECVVARKVSPDRLTTMADKLRELRGALVSMEKNLRTAAVQAELGEVKEKPKGNGGKKAGNGSKKAAAGVQKKAA
jgi:hypothetical protein